MATFMQAADRLPSLTGESDKDVKSLHNYVFSLQEALRYTLANLGEDNFNDIELDNIRKPVMIALEDAKSELRYDLQVTAEGLSSVIQTQGGEISSLQQSVTGLSSTVATQAGQISTISQKADRIDLIVAQGATQTNVQLTPAALNAISQNITLTADQIQMTGSVTFLQPGANISQLNNNRGYQTSSGVTSIIGGYLETNTIVADELRGNHVYIRASGGGIYGDISAESDGGSTAFQLLGAGMRLLSRGNLYLAARVTVGSSAGDPSITMSASTQRLTMWADGGIYGNDTLIVTSDRQKKHDVEYDISQYDAVFDALSPCRYKLNAGRSERYHTGFIAQDVVMAVENAGMDAQDFGAYCEWEEESGERTCGLRYEEFIALLVQQVQSIKARMAAAGI